MPTLVWVSTLKLAVNVNVKRLGFWWKRSGVGSLSPTTQGSCNNPCRVMVMNYATYDACIWLMAVLMGKTIR